MSLLEWQDDYRVGVDEVDHEHREMIRLINDLHASIGPGRAPERIEAMLGEIHARIAAHFALEEKAMQAGGYDQYADHKADHERLLDEIRDIMDEHAARGILDDAAFASRLAAWFGTHFRTKDARLHRHFSSGAA